MLRPLPYSFSFFFHLNLQCVICYENGSENMTNHVYNRPIYRIYIANLEIYRKFKCYHHYFLTFIHQTYPTDGNVLSKSICSRFRN
uniref:Uncharacterized protein n=1 Tax=Anopheles albimanus TaxID=7167 RepID=A0A182FWV1_ANOAL